MLKVMLIDDNRLALEYFSTLVDWSAYGYTLVCTASDGEAGLIEFRRHKPDLVITDVQMPNMNGIELTEEILKTAPDTVVIFLSSFEEFSYVKSALKLGVYDYILKHQTKAQDLADKLTAVKKLLESRSADAHFISEGHLVDFLENGDLSTSAGRQSLFHHFPHRYDLRLLVLPHYLTVIEDTFGLQCTALSEKTVKSCLYQDNHTVAVIRCSAFVYLLLSTASENTISHSYTLQNSIRQAGSDVSILSISENTHIVDALTKWQQLNIPENQMQFFPTGSVLYLEMIRESPVGIAKTHVSPVEELLQSRQLSPLLCQLDEQLRPVLLTKNYPVFSEVVTPYLSVLFKYHHQVMDIRKSEFFSVVDTVFSNSWFDAYSLYTWIKERYLTLFSLLSQMPDENYSPLVRQVMKKIYQEYSDSELSAETIADEFHVGINQLNNLMKKETSYTVWKLLIRVRMTKAKALLEETDLKIADISEQTGYKTVSYFSNVYRKYYGISAQEFRRNLRQAGKEEPL